MSEWTEIILIGLGSQGKAWAQNLKESGLSLQCFLRPQSQSIETAKQLGLEVISELKGRGPFLLLIPDNQIFSFLEEASLGPDSVVIYGHGASLVEHELHQRFPHLDHVLLAPKAIASELRANYKTDGKTGAVYSVEFVAPERKETVRGHLLNLASALGINVGPFEVTFKQETVADLLSEQTLLCGLIPYAAKMCFDRLRAEGIPMELAYLEAWHEVKLIANAMSQKGPAALFDMISPHALAGASKASKDFFDKEYHSTIERLLSEIKSGDFFQDANRFLAGQEKTAVLNDWKESAIEEAFQTIGKQLI